MLSPIGFLGRFSKKSLESLGFLGKRRKRHAETTKPSGKYGLEWRNVSVTEVHTPFSRGGGVLLLVESRVRPTAWLPGRVALTREGSHDRDARAEVTGGWLGSRDVVSVAGIFWT